MKQLTKDPNAAAKAQAAERRANEESGLKSINISLNPSGSSTKKKPVFKSTLQPQNAAAVPSAPDPAVSTTVDDDPSGAVRNGWYEDRYDPKFVTGCEEDCPVCHGKNDPICL